MPDKHKENKLAAMLERRGYLRKTVSEEEPVEEEAAGASSRPEADLRYLFTTPEDDAPKVTPAARQPVPGISSPVIPTERTQSPDRDEPRMTERVVLPVTASLADREEPAPPKPVEREQPRPIEREQPKPAEREQPRPAEREQPRPAEREQPRPAEREQPRPVEREQPRPVEREQPRPVEREQPRPADVPRPAPAPVATPAYARQTPVSPPTEITTYERPPQPQPLPQPGPYENYTERYLDIDSLYEALALRSKRTDTIYLVEEYLKTLPDSLPDESRRDIVSKIIAASGFDYDLLTGDGVLRVKMLKDYAERFAQYTEDYVTARQTELEDLEQQMIRVRRLIENRRELHKRQFFAIEAEAQRLKELLTFITG